MFVLKQDVRVRRQSCKKGWKKGWKVGVEDGQASGGREGEHAPHILLTFHDSLKLRPWEELFLFFLPQTQFTQGHTLCLHPCQLNAISLEIESLGEDVRSRSNRLAVAQQWVSEADKDPGIDPEWGAAVYRRRMRPLVEGQHKVYVSLKEQCVIFTIKWNQKLKNSHNHVYYHVYCWWFA